LNSISDRFLDLLSIKPDKPESKLSITKFGNFTANFRALPPPIPPEYAATLFTVVATAYVLSNYEMYNRLYDMIAQTVLAGEESSRLKNTERKLKEKESA
jgi:hypothetical protein